MKCKICEIEIPKDSLNCPACGKSVEELKRLGLIGKKSHKLLITLVVFVVAIILALGASIFLYIKYAPKLVFRTAVSQTINFVGGYNSLDYDTETVDFDIDLNISGNNEYKEMFDIINKIKINGKVGTDNRNSKIYSEFKSSYDNETLLNFNTFIHKNKFYIKYEDIYDKYLKTELDGVKIDNSVASDYQIIMKKLFWQFDKSVKLKNFKREYEDEYTKNSLILTEKESYEIFEKMTDYLKKDSEFMDSLERVTGMKDRELVKKMDELLEVDRPMSETKDLVVNIYTKKFKFDIIKLEIDIDGDLITVDYNNEEYVDVSLYIENDVINLKFPKEIKDQNKMSVNFIDGDGVTIKLDVDYTIKYNEEITEPDVSNAQNYDTFSEEDSAKLAQGILKSKGFNKILEDVGLGGILGSEGSGGVFEGIFSQV